MLRDDRWKGYANVREVLIGGLLGVLASGIGAWIAAGSRAARARKTIREEHELIEALGAESEYATRLEALMKRRIEEYLAKHERKSAGDHVMGTTQQQDTGLMALTTGLAVALGGLFFPLLDDGGPVTFLSAAFISMVVVTQGAVIWNWYERRGLRRMLISDPTSAPTRDDHRSP